MNILLDTHTIIWFYDGSSELSDKIKNIIKDYNNTCYVSIASLWEITIKYSLGKLKIEKGINDFFEFLINNNFSIIQIDFSHLLKLNSLLKFHADPFDRIIISQALSEGLPIATIDKIFSQYEVQIEW
ncbi:MAG: type II toxin-antitoxin system VapC family toxin [Rickettsiales bacterium]|nr:type II toxin-antitoxin system VapC family toxin [Rickettsiales bacterium]